MKLGTNIILSETVPYVVMFMVKFQHGICVNMEDRRENTANLIRIVCMVCTR
jgi:hypothetical protein